jgi:hypothetical protein
VGKKGAVGKQEGMIRPRDSLSALKQEKRRLELIFPDFNCRLQHAFVITSVLGMVNKATAS